MRIGNDWKRFIRHWMEITMVSLVTTRDEISMLYSQRGEIGLQRYLEDLGFDLEKPIKMEVSRGKAEFWQPEDDLLIVPQAPVVNGSQRKQFMKNMGMNKRMVLK